MRLSLNYCSLDPLASPPAGVTPIRAEPKAKVHIGRYAGRIFWDPYEFGILEKTWRDRVDCLEPNLVGLETVVFITCSQKSSSNGTLLLDLWKLDFGVLRHAGSTYSVVSIYKTRSHMMP